MKGSNGKQLMSHFVSLRKWKYKILIFKIIVVPIIFFTALCVTAAGFALSSTIIR